MTARVGSFLILLFCSPLARADIVLWARAGNHRARVELHSSPFDRKAHKVRKAKQYGYLVDEKPALGTDLALPNEEVTFFQASIDGKRLRIPGRLWKDCFEPNLKERHCNAILSKDGRVLFVNMFGSDGVGAYWVRWSLRLNGRHTRAIKSADEWTY